MADAGELEFASLSDGGVTELTESRYAPDPPEVKTNLIDLENAFEEALDALESSRTALFVTENGSEKAAVLPVRGAIGECEAVRERG